MTTINDPKGAAGALKAPMWLLPPVALEQTAWVHKFGADKYQPYNWRATGVCATTYVSAIMRHLNAWRDGQDLDPESGFSHIAHIATSCNILMDALACGTLQDDRNRRPGCELPYTVSPVADREGGRHCTARQPSVDTLHRLFDLYPGLFAGVDKTALVEGVLHTTHDQALATPLYNHGGSKKFDYQPLEGSPWIGLVDPAVVAKWRAESRQSEPNEGASAEATRQLYDLNPQLVEGAAEEIHRRAFGDTEAQIEALRTPHQTPESGVTIDGHYRPFPEVPVGFLRWEYRGLGWAPGRPVKYAFWDVFGGEWESALAHPMGADTHYLEAIPQFGLPGDRVLVDPVRGSAFEAVLENFVEVRGAAVYRFAKPNGECLSFHEDDLIDVHNLDNPTTHP